MGLREELGMDRPIETIEHECLLNIVYTGTTISRLSYRYFSRFGVTDAQFNVLMQLKYSGDEGLSQVALSRRLFVNKADMTGLVDRLEKGKMVERGVHPDDRRVNVIRITKKGLELLGQAEAAYFEGVKKLMQRLSKGDMKNIIASMEKIRENVRNGGVL